MRKFGIGAASVRRSCGCSTPPPGGGGVRSFATEAWRCSVAVARSGVRAGRGVGAEAYGVGQRADARAASSRRRFDDVTLKNKVETEIFRDADAPKGQVDVNAQDGVVQLRGEVESPQLIDELVERARSVQGVRDVENLLHVPGTPAPMHQ